MESPTEQLTKKLLPLTSQIVHHPLYQDISSIASLRVFMNEHVFAVWDFMCLLKELHRCIVSTSAPWLPPTDAFSANLIGSILLEEEGDITEDGSYASHFDIYLSAMEQVGADTQPIKKLLALLTNGHSLKEAIDSVSILPSTRHFVLTTFSFFGCLPHELAAAFVYGRENITSSMFAPLLKRLSSTLSEKEQQNYSALIYYLKRHITLDNSEHFPKALQMLANLIGQDDQKLEQAESAAARALNARIEFLTDIHAHLQKKLMSA